MSFQSLKKVKYDSDETIINYSLHKNIYLKLHHLEGEYVIFNTSITYPPFLRYNISLSSTKPIKYKNISDWINESPNRSNDIELNLKTFKNREYNVNQLNDFIKKINQINQINERNYNSYTVNLKVSFSEINTQKYIQGFFINKYHEYNNSSIIINHDSY